MQQSQGMKQLEPAERAKLLMLARDAIAWGVENGVHSGYRVPPGDRDAFPEPTACFVSLHTVDDDLRGCIGSLEAQRPLAEAVVESAMGAAFRDPRFPPLQSDELERVRIEISILSPSEPVPAASESELLAQLHPGEDGLVLEYGEQRATFLPVVWEQFDQPADFLAALKRKAGLPSDGWPEGIRVYRYTTYRVSEAAYAAGGQPDAV
jgi:AmmeMemoRadiSam system protein A